MKYSIAGARLHPEVWISCFWPLLGRLVSISPPWSGAAQPSQEGLLPRAPVNGGSHPPSFHTEPFCPQGTRYHATALQRLGARSYFLLIQAVYSEDVLRYLFILKLSSTF